MPKIVLTLTDTPNGAVAIHSSFQPAAGHPLSPAQAHALDIVNTTCRKWGMHIDAAPGGLQIPTRKSSPADAATGAAS